jgi:hypothetical protein
LRVEGLVSGKWSLVEWRRPNACAVAPVYRRPIERDARRPRVVGDDGRRTAICGKTDDLRGLKENVIMGRLIPAGTGLSAYKKLSVVIQGEPIPQPAPPPRPKIDLELSAVNE